jgi:eight-cysteine-cluster-containing protein
MRRQLLGSAFLAGLLCAGAACVGQSATHIANEVTDGGACPPGWRPGSVINMLCARGLVPLRRTFQGVDCITCAPEDGGASPCDGSAKCLSAADGKCPRGFLESTRMIIDCRPGYSPETFTHGALRCQRCIAGPAPMGCENDDDCVVGGCSGEVCTNEPAISTCIYRPEFACYREPFAQCACHTGKCAWEQNDELLQCLARRRDFVHLRERLP